MIDVLIYKISCILSGLLIIFWGYRLFVKGIFNESGDVTGNWKDSKLIIKKAAPGTYFVLFGSLIIAFSIFKGYSSEEHIGARKGSVKDMQYEELKKEVLPPGDTIKIR